MSKMSICDLLKQLVVIGSALASLSTTAQSLFNKAFDYENYMGNLEPVSGPGGFLICSTIRYDLGYLDGFQFTRFDSTGNVILTRAFSTGSLVNVMQWGALSLARSNGTYAFLFGSSPSNGGYRPSLRVFNTTASGSIIWNRLVSYSAQDSSFDFIGAMDQAFEETPDEGYLITGLRKSPSSGAPVVVKLDSTGNILWNKTYDLHQPWGWHVVSDVDETGTLLLGFHADSTALVISNNCILTKIDPNGSTIWSKRIDGFEGMLTGCTRVDGRYVISALDTSNLYILELDTAGVPFWGKRYTLPFQLPTWGMGIHPTHDHGFVMTAELPDSVYGSDVYFFKVDSLGTVLWERTYGNGDKVPIDLLENNDSTLTLLTGGEVGYFLSRLDASGMNECITPVSEWLTEIPITFSLVDVTLDEFESQMTSQPLYLGDSLAYDPLMVDTCFFAASIADVGLVDGLLIYPNPTSGSLSVRIAGHFLGAKLTVVDMLGAQVLDVELSSAETRIDLGAFPSGVFLYRAVAPDAKILSGRFVKE